MFKTSLCTDEHPHANWQADKFNPSKRKLLIHFRNTPNNSTGMTPASLMIYRDIKTKLPGIVRSLITAHHMQAQQRDAESKAKQKLYVENYRCATVRDYKFY